MRKYICTVCGYDYEEAEGDPARGIAPGTKWEDVPEDWVCPVCGADKSMFTLEGGEEKPEQPAAAKPAEPKGPMGFMELSALCSNLARGCAKQYLPEEAGLFTRLADFFEQQAVPEGDLEGFAGLLNGDIQAGYSDAFAAAREAGDRGALRALTWGEKVSKIQSGLVSKVINQGEGALEGRVFVCEACGFIFVGEAPPAICPVCKVPSFKFNEVQRGA